MFDPQTLFLALIVGAFTAFAAVLGFISFWSRGGAPAARPAARGVERPARAPHRAS